MSVESLKTLESQKSFSLFDELIQSLNSGCQNFYREPPSYNPITTLLKSTATRTEKVNFYPLLEIDINECMNCYIKGSSLIEIQFIILRFIEKTFSRLGDFMPVNQTPLKRRAKQKRFTATTATDDDDDAGVKSSYISILLNYSKIIDENFSTNVFWSANKAIEGIIQIFSGLIIKSILIIGGNRSGVFQWKNLIAGIQQPKSTQLQNLHHHYQKQRHY